MKGILEYSGTLTPFVGIWFLTCLVLYRVDSHKSEHQVGKHTRRASKSYRLLRAGGRGPVCRSTNKQLRLCVWFLSLAVPGMRQSLELRYVFSSSTGKSDSAGRIPR